MSNTEYVSVLVVAAVTTVLVGIFAGQEAGEGATLVAAAVAMYAAWMCFIRPRLKGSSAAVADEPSQP